jgi:hypothetical protein
MCHSPKYYNVKVLPLEIKQQVLDHYNVYIEWVKSSDQPDKVKDNFIKLLNGVTKFMFSEDYSQEWLSHFIDQTRKLDEIRKQDIKLVVPQLRGLF